MATYKFLTVFAFLLVTVSLASAYPADDVAVDAKPTVSF